MVQLRIAFATEEQQRDAVKYITNTIQAKLDGSKMQISTGEEPMINIPRVLICPGQDFEPRSISIGPYYWGNPRLRSMYNKKLDIVNAILERNHARSLEDYIGRLLDLQDQVRKSYTEDFKLSEQEFVEMMLLDGCFIVEYFLLTKYDFNRPTIARRSSRTDCSVLTSMGVLMFNGYGDLMDSKYMRRIIEHDMLLLQNQLPFFVVQSILGLVCEQSYCLSNAILQFFNRSSFLQIRPFVNDESISPPKSGQHLLHFYHQFLTCAPKPQCHTPIKINSIKPEKDVLRIPSATALASAGVKFKKKKGFGLLGVSFNQGIMEIPSLLIDGFTKSLIQNLVAFEKSNPQIEPQITAYVKFLGHIIDTSEDVALLHKKCIINHALGSDEEVAHLFNSTGGSTFHDQPDYMKCIYQDVDEYCKIKWHKWRAILMSNYFNSPWSFMKWGAAVILLVLAFLQTFFTIYPYFHPHT